MSVEVANGSLLSLKSDAMRKVLLFQSPTDHVYSPTAGSRWGTTRI